MHPGTRATIHRGNWDLRETIGTRKTIRTVWTWKEDDRVHATAENVGEGSDMELSLLTCPPAFPMVYRGGELIVSSWVSGVGDLERVRKVPGSPQMAAGRGAPRAAAEGSGAPSSGAHP